MPDVRRDLDERCGRLRRWRQQRDLHGEFLVVGGVAGHYVGSAVDPGTSTGNSAKAAQSRWAAVFRSLNFANLVVPGSAFHIAVSSTFDSPLASISSTDCTTSSRSETIAGAELCAVTLSPRITKSVMLSSLSGQVARRH